MKCPNCNYETNYDFEYCPACGAQPYSLSVSLNPAADSILPALNDTLFLIICILTSATALLPIFNGNGLPVLNILFTVFLWLTYSAARKGFADEKQLKNLSGTVYAMYVITNVCVVLLFVLGVIFGLLFGYISHENGIKEEIIAELGAELPQEIIPYVDTILGVSGWFFFIVFAVLAALTLVINLCCIRKIHLFTKSVYKSVEDCALRFEYVDAASTCLCILGGLSILGSIGGIGDIPAFINSIFTGISGILAGVLVKKYCKETYTP